MEIFLILYMFVSLNILKGDSVLYKQIIWYFLGFLFYLILKKIKPKYIYNIIFIIYILLNFCLLYLLLFGKVINGAKVWINLGFFNFQPSELMKITLIILLSILKNKNNLILFVITLIPSILTFLEPDTGNVIFYFLILFVILFQKNKKMLIKISILTFICGLLFVTLFFINNNLFIDIFGYSFFYRFDRIINLFNKTSYQLNQALIGMGSSYLFGLNGKISIPALNTDFAFAKIIIKTGLIGGLIYLIINYIFNMEMINKINKKKGIIKDVGNITMIVKIVQEFVHILMNIGLFPIIGITLPFISYGGSSIISYFIIFGLINNKEYMK